MAISVAATRIDQANYFASKVKQIALCTGNPGPGPTIANEVTGGSPAYARKVPVWASAVDDGTEATASAGELEFDVPMGSTVTHVAFINEDGTLRDSADSADIPFTSAQGKLRVTPRHKQK